MFFKTDVCYGDPICGRCSSSTMWIGVYFCGNTIFPETTLYFAKLLSWHISKRPWSPTSTTEQTLIVFHGVLSTFSLWWEAQQKLSSGRRLLLLLHARRQKWKDAKKFIKYHVSHFQLSKLFWFVRFISSFGGIFTLTIWGTSYFSLPVPEFPETMLCLTLSCVVKWTDRNHTRYLRYLRYSHERRQFKWFDKESTKSRQYDHIKKSKCWITSCGSTSNSVRQNYWLWKCSM